MTKSARQIEMEKAMAAMLSQRQIDYIKSRTWLGFSKVATLRRLVNIGIDIDKKRAGRVEPKSDAK